MNSRHHSLNDGIKHASVVVNCGKRALICESSLSQSRVPLRWTSANTALRPTRTSTRSFRTWWRRCSFSWRCRVLEASLDRDSDLPEQLQSIASSIATLSESVALYFQGIVLLVWAQRTLYLTLQVDFKAMTELGPTELGPDRVRRDGVRRGLKL